jgi:hypothetical protein
MAARSVPEEPEQIAHKNQLKIKKEKGKRKNAAGYISSRLS